MSRQIHFRPQAGAEVLEARRWYEERQPGLGARFAAAVEDAVERLTAKPFAFPCVHGETRRAILRRFPYAVYFRVLDDNIVVLSVIHGRRDPRQWQSRT